MREVDGLQLVDRYPVAQEAVGQPGPAAPAVTDDWLGESRLQLADVDAAVVMQVADCERVPDFRREVFPCQPVDLVGTVDADEPPRWGLGLRWPSSQRGSRRPVGVLEAGDGIAKTQPFAALDVVDDVT